ncbi:GNAT family N-acetyltransferase [Chitinophagaceae bacterium 26-R-25]|nr:GNAT family N-acetyltransferase [Chitinophagaceae bacterium 26-R-25]
MEEIKIIIASTEHADLIAEMSQQTFYDSFHEQNTKEDMEKFLNEQFTIPALKAEVGKEGNIFLLAYLNDVAAGYVRLREEPLPEANSSANAIELARIYCTKEFIGKGVGSALMKKSLSIAKEMNKEVIWLGVWEFNPTAIAFYKKFGFEQFSEHEFLLGNDRQRDVLMKKTL